MKAEAKPFDPTKPVQTRDGKPARIVCSDRVHSDPILALVKEAGREEILFTYQSNGLFIAGEKNKLDLVNTPEVTIVWANVYAWGASSTCEKKESAITGGSEDRLGVWRFEIHGADDLRVFKEHS